MRILSIDASSHTGWAIFQDKKLIQYGKIDVPCQDSSWPWGVMKWAEEIAEQITRLVINNSIGFNKVVIERANSSRFRDSQNVLDWMHFCILKNSINDVWNDIIIYMDSSEWRKICKINLSKEQKKHNQMVSKEKRKGNKIVKVNGKRVGRLTKKHLAVFYCNENFGTTFKIKDNDIAEAICLGWAYLTREENE